MDIRPEQTDDHQVIHTLTATAFAPKAYSDGTEADVIDKLRESGDLTLSLVAVKEDVIVGHVAFSPVVIGQADTGWFGLGPVSVLPTLQRTGIGTALINSGLGNLEDQGAVGCALIGDPNYYSRFGFISDGSVQYQDLPDRLVQWKSFKTDCPKGKLIFSPAFGE